MAAHDYAPQSRARRQGASLLAYPSLEKATINDFKSGATAIFIHGFTADSSYLRQLMHQFTGADFKCFAFEYPSDRGIDHAARQLRGLLEGYDENGLLVCNKIVLIGHSMGGLVARAFVAFEEGERFVRTVIALGSPHRGTLAGAKILEYMLAWGESVSGLSLLSFPAESASGKQLLGLDAEQGQQSVISRLNATRAPDGVTFHSISGALPSLEFGRNPIRNLLANSYLSKHLSKPHDGLVEEASSNLAGAEFADSAPGCEHHSDYADYRTTNHSHLVDNQTVALLALRCAMRSTPPGPDEQEAHAVLEKARVTSQSVKPPV